MTVRIVQLHSITESSSYPEYVEYVADGSEGGCEIVFSVQSSLSVFEALQRKFVNQRFIYVGEQRRTSEEYYLLYALFGIVADEIYDPVKENVTSLADYREPALCQEIVTQFGKCHLLRSMSLHSNYHFIGLEAILSTISERAEKLVDVFRYKIDYFKVLVDIESKLARGLVTKSKGEMASSGLMDCGVINGFDRILDEYRWLSKSRRCKSEFLDDRKDLLIALTTKSAVYNQNSLIKFLLVQSAYCFSLSQFFNVEDPDLAALFLFRSFESIVLSIGLSCGIIAHSYVGGDVSYARNGKKFEGVGSIWYLLRDEKIVPDGALATSLSALITMRNKSFLGHGFSHVSQSAVEIVERDLVNLVKNQLSEELSKYWLRYKRCSRPVRIMDICEDSELNILDDY
ncbi:hypothetical protein DYI41_05010 [Marinobacter salarius]|uniref:hypothetical protein n=1 Tax=Marinobacter salarius TaxID=1420917 RepID=UPI001BD03A2D|nr:hypothetical protein [Marinobacter salarius]MBS8230284.1 hypothetical protein [Marinobacter salarius]